jgi:hypothetical protein
LNWFSRSWARIIGIPARALTKRLSSQLPNDAHSGIDLIVSDRRLETHAPRFFAHTKEALAIVETRAPKGFTQLSKDVRTIVLFADVPKSSYHSLQLAVLVPSQTALERDTLSYAAWLLYASGLSRGSQEAVARADELLLGLPSHERERIATWLFDSDAPPE